MLPTKITRLEKGIRVGIILALGFLAGETRAQSPAAANAGTQEKMAALKESIAQNQAALKTYKWTEATEISLKGEVKKKEQKAVSVRPRWKGAEDACCRRRTGSERGEGFRTRRAQGRRGS